MKDRIKELVRESARKAYDKGELTSDQFPPVVVDEPKNGAHGDLFTNFAMVSASAQKMPPRKIAEAIIGNLADPEGIIARTEIAGPGFINFFITPSAWHPVLTQIHEKDGYFGAVNLGRGRKVMVEFVSANPTGPLHVGHGRGAVVGDTIASILSFCGYFTDREYYINDAGRQIHTLGRSVYLRLKEISGHTVDFPEDAYQGDYICDIARAVLKEKGNWVLSLSEEEAVHHCSVYAGAVILEGIKTDLLDLGVVFGNWFSEQGLYDSGKVDAAIRELKEKALIYEFEGALWFKATAFGDEKDRVVVRQNGQTTYFASDIAYHRDKYERGYDRAIDVWGADHHGYAPRLGAAVSAFGHGEEQFRVVLVQLVNLLRQGAPVSMSTRSGQFVTLSEVVNEVGRDAARFIFLTRHHESPLDFDLEVAKQKSNDNPVYYVQYVHARISSIMKKAQEEWGIASLDADSAAVSLLIQPEEIALMKHLARYPETIAAAAQLMEPHRIAYYLMELAAAFHAYYNRHRVLTDDPVLTAGRLYLVVAVRKIIRNGLNLLGVSAPESM